MARRSFAEWCRDRSAEQIRIRVITLRPHSRSDGQAIERQLRELDPVRCDKLEVSGKAEWATGKTHTSVHYPDFDLLAPRDIGRVDDGDLRRAGAGARRRSLAPRRGVSALRRPASVIVTTSSTLRVHASLTDRWDSPQRAHRSSGLTSRWSAAGATATRSACAADRLGIRSRSEPSPTSRWQAGGRWWNPENRSPSSACRSMFPLWFLRAMPPRRCGANSMRLIGRHSDASFSSSWSTTGQPTAR